MVTPSVHRRRALRMWRRAVVALFAVALLAGGCSSGDSGDESASSSSTPTSSAPATSTTVMPSGDSVGSPTSAAPTTAPATSAPATTAAPSSSAPATTAAASGAGLDLATDGCAWTPPSETSLTFVTDGRLFEIGTDGEVRCLAEGVDTASLSWAPTGERALIDDGVVFGSGGRIDTGATGRAEGGWTWPTGRRFVQASGDTLTKVEADGSGVIDISFLEEHGAATYHPDGLHLAVAGTGTASGEFWDGEEVVVEEWTQTGLFLVKNDGTGEQVWIDTLDAEILEVVFSADGTRLSFIADHGDNRHIHSFDLPDLIWDGFEEGERILTVLPEDPVVLEPQFETVGALSHLTIDPSRPDWVLFAHGDCAEGSEVEMIDLASGGYPIPVAPDLNAVPIGFLGSERMALLELDPECNGRGALWVVDRDGGRTLIAQDVDAAAMRWQAPELLLTLQDITIAGFA